jgi:hypothetical protein
MVYQPIKRQPLSPEQVREQQKRQAEADLARVRANLPAKAVAATVVTTAVAPAAAPAFESADAYLNSGGMSVGRVIRFDGKNGRFVFKDDDSEVSSDTDFVMLGDGAWVGWIKFHEEGAPEHVGGLISDQNFRRPGREELGDDNPTLWPASKFADRPEDPWKEAIYIPLEQRETGELFTLQATQSPTTINAFKALLSLYQRRAKSDPNHYPVIRLKVGEYPNKKFGMLPKPAFTIVGKAEKKSTAKPDTSIAADMNDEIPL